MLKKLFLILLILGIILPSYAGVSVSDGSNFVSKSEFSSNLSSLSNRMSILENSLDAKIDSLVSAYLNKNGIWNGEKQELLYYKSGSTNYSSLVNPTGEFPYYNGVTAGPKFTNINHTSDTTVTGTNSWFCNMFELYDLFTASKSGLCFFRIFISYPTTSSAYMMYPYAGKHQGGTNLTVSTSSGNKTVLQAWQQGLLTRALWNGLEKSQEPVHFIAYWFDTKKEYDAEKGVNYWGLNEKPVQGKTYFANSNKSNSYEFVPKYAESTLGWDMPQDIFNYIMGSVFVNKGTTYSFGLKLWWGIVPYQYGVTSSNAEQLTGLYLGPSSEATSFITNYFNIY